MAIAKNTPAAKEFAIPSIFGFSLQERDIVGMIPHKNASANTIKMNPNFHQKQASNTTVIKNNSINQM